MFNRNTTYLIIILFSTEYTSIIKVLKKINDYKKEINYNYYIF